MMSSRIYISASGTGSVGTEVGFAGADIESTSIGSVAGASDAGSHERRTGLTGESV